MAKNKKVSCKGIVCDGCNTFKTINFDKNEDFKDFKCECGKVTRVFKKAIKKERKLVLKEVSENDFSFARTPSTGLVFGKEIKIKEGI